MYVYMYIYTYMCIYVCMYIYIYIYVIMISIIIMPYLLYVIILLDWNILLYYNIWYFINARAAEVKSGKWPGVAACAFTGEEYSIV